MNRYKDKWVVREPKQIPYGFPKRTLGEKVRKVFNTILAFMAYRCPINRWRVKLHHWRGVNIGENVYIGMYCVLDNFAPEYIYLEDNVNINAGTMILTHFNPDPRFKNLFVAEIRPVVISELAMVSVRCTILPGVNIGKYAFVSAGCVVEKNVPAYHLLQQKADVHLVNIEKFVKNK